MIFNPGKGLQVLFAAVMVCSFSGVSLYAQEAESNSLIADESERLKPVDLFDDSRIPVFGGDVLDGEYEVKVSSSSSMFRIEKALLTVKDGDMSAVLTLGGKGYTKLFMGTGEQAVAADESEYSEAVPDQNEKLTFKVNVDALNQVLECTGFSRRKKKWYDHQILFDASSMPEKVLLVPVNQQKKVELKDGDYTVPVSLSGGTGRASVKSPAKLSVVNGYAVVELVWSSPNYDYMRVNGQIFRPLASGSNSRNTGSVFVVPVYDSQRVLPVVADTVAMSQNHEINYWLEFDFNAVNKKSFMLVWLAIVCGVLGAGFLTTGIVLVIRKKSRNSKK